MAKKFGIVVKEDNKDALKLSNEINEYLLSKGIETLYDKLSTKRLKLKSGRDISEMDVDLILVLGGDGTILWAESKISDKNIPILGINFGSMGFLTEILPGEWKVSLDKILAGEYSIEERSKIEVKVNGKIIGEALNEAVVMTAIPLKMLHLEIRVDDQVADVVRSDGIIISTPTGSTAYSMSAGGPIVDPKVGGFVITSICPFKLGARSLVVADTSRVSVKPIRPKKEAMIVIDGAIKRKLKPLHHAIFKLSNNRSYFIKFEKDFYGRIRERLGK